MSLGSSIGRFAEPHSITRRTFLTGSCAAGLGFAAYAGTHGRHQYEIVPRTFRIQDLPASFEGFRIVQMSDIHLEEYTETWFLEEMVRRTNAQRPDMVLLTGDFVSRGPMPLSVSWRAAAACAEVLSGLTAPLRYAILGNHDRGVGASHVIEPLESHGIPVLVNSHLPLERGSDMIWLCGLDDVEGGDPILELAVPAEPRAPVIFLCHEPDFVDRVLQHPRFALIDLMLSGHSHGGQVRLPFIGPLILPPLGNKYFEGLYRFGRTQLYVNRGIGTVGLPFRFNCPAELTHITLTAA